ncbi:unnamed protein product, partial [marine sediment metagenome]
MLVFILFSAGYIIKKVYQKRSPEKTIQQLSPQQIIN